MDVSGKTKVTGIFGYPVEHTLSPLMHNAAFRALGLDICYVPFSVHPRSLHDAVKSIRSLNLLGVNITVPHKEKVMPLLDRIDEEAFFIGAVNTVTNSDGILTGYNTDGRGFISSLSEKGISFEGREVFIAGAGGASRAISYYLSVKASRLSLFDIDAAKTDRLATDLSRIRDNVSVIRNMSDFSRADILINATTLGMKPDDPLPISPELISPETVVCDLIYKNTRLLQTAESRGAKTVNGSGMLLWQGVLAFELWTGQKPPVDLMRNILLANIK